MHSVKALLTMSASPFVYPLRTADQAPYISRANAREVFVAAYNFLGSMPKRMVLPFDPVLTPFPELSVGFRQWKTRLITEYFRGEISIHNDKSTTLVAAITTSRDLPNVTEGLLLGFLATTKTWINAGPDEDYGTYYTIEIGMEVEGLEGDVSALNVSMGSPNPFIPLRHSLHGSAVSDSAGVIARDIVSQFGIEEPTFAI